MFMCLAYPLLSLYTKRARYRLFSILWWVAFPSLSWGQGPVNICLDQARIPYHSRDHLSKVHGFLGSGTVLQLPDMIRKNLKFTGQNPPRFDWKAIQKVWDALPPHHDIYAPNLRGERLYPVKVLRTSGGSLQGRHSIGYIPLKSLIHSSTHRPCGVVTPGENPSMVESQRPVSPSPTNPSSSQGRFYFFQTGGGENTSQAPVVPEIPRVVPIPSVRPARRSPPPPSKPAGRPRGYKLCQRKPRCGGDSHVKIDLAARCMCVGQDCFKVGIGKKGPRMTWSGFGRLGVARGAKYSTRKRTTTRYDRDALSMGIPRNDLVGKWIHKTRRCRPTSRTFGCVSVPCVKWPVVKKAMGSQLVVCNGRGRVKNKTGKKSKNNPTSR